MRDVELLRVTSTYVLARGYRYGRQWFIKGLREEFRRSATMQRRLVKEFEIHSRLRHPNIVEVVGFEEIEGLGQCIIQEWVDGSTLRELLSNGSLSAADRRRVMHELMAAVAYLHRSGVVHRDIKPSNVMVRKTGGETVLIDFGLADSDDYVEIKEPAGTRGFISPEQLEAGGVAPSDDVYSLGVVMREMCPRYRKIAGSCTGPVANRPADADALLKSVDARDRRPKIVMAILSALILLSVAGIAAVRFKTLEKDAVSSREQIAKLTQSNAGNEMLVTSLRDSLAEVQKKFTATNDELTQVRAYEALRQSIFNEGCQNIDRILSSYDREVFAKIEEGDVSRFNDGLMKLVAELNTKIERYIPSIENCNSLESADADKLKMDLYNYEAVKLSEYQKKWQTKIVTAK